MRVADFDFILPEELIAQRPLSERTSSRLLILQRENNALIDAYFNDISAYLKPGDLLIFNNTRVIPARLFGQKASGGKVELLIDRILNEHEALAFIRASKSPKPGTIIYLDGDHAVIVKGRQEDYFHIQTATPLLKILDAVGRVPLPPYIKRADAAEDLERYQTVYAESLGAVAAPTAGLHFDHPLLQRLNKAGVNSAFLTLHVGAGTFQPVRVDAIKDHHMHAEWFEITDNLIEKINETKKNGGRVIAVGTTSARALESAAQSGKLSAYRGETQIFIYPGFQFNVIDGLITNFHLPRSTLLMLVSALAGRDRILEAYQYAINARYRFFSYGDAMLIV